MKVLLDTNLLLDVLVKREPHYRHASKIWALTREGLLESCISAISVNNLYYIIQKVRERSLAEAFVDQLLSDFGIVALTKEILHQARLEPGRDYEDLIQYFSAIHAGCEFLVTRSKKDFPKTGITVVASRELLKHIDIPPS